MKTKIIATITASIFFTLGFFASNYFVKKDIEPVIKIPVDKEGYNHSIFGPEEYFVYLTNWMLKMRLERSDSIFYKALSKDFYLNRSWPVMGSISLIKKEEKYYECVISRKERKEYQFENFYLITPDTIYKLKPYPITFQFDTILDIKK
jgi:hypothetical protein